MNIETSTVDTSAHPTLTPVRMWRSGELFDTEAYPPPEVFNHCYAGSLAGQFYDPIAELISFDELFGLINGEHGKVNPEIDISQWETEMIRPNFGCLGIQIPISNIGAPCYKIEMPQRDVNSAIAIIARHAVQQGMPIAGAYVGYNWVEPNVLIPHLKRQIDRFDAMARFDLNMHDPAIIVAGAEGLTVDQIRYCNSLFASIPIKYFLAAK